MNDNLHPIFKEIIDTHFPDGGETNPMTTDYKERKLKEFDERFDDPVYLAELAAEIHQGDANLNAIRDFLSSTIDELMGEKERLILPVSKIAKSK